MSLHSLLSIALLLIVFAVPNAGAEQIAGLYKVAVPVDSQSSKDLQAATRVGLATVLVRVSGQASVLEPPVISKAIKQARRYVKQFQYEDRRISGDDSSLKPAEQLQLVLEFESQLIEQLLRDAGLPSWSSNRPAVLVWIVVEDSNGRRFVAREADAGILDAVSGNAQRRGLPLTFPALDLEDMVAMSPDELWQLNPYGTQTAVERYQASAVLLGRISQLSNGQWLGRWLFHFDGRRLRFDGDAETIDDYISVAMDQVAELMAVKYAIAPVDISEGGLLMRLTGVSDFSDYAQAIRYLEGLAAIHHANVVHIAGDEIIVRLIADGLLPQLEQALALDQRLLPGTPGGYEGDYPIVLDYQWPVATPR